MARWTGDIQAQIPEPDAQGARAQSLMPAWVTLILGPFIVMNAVIGIVTYVTLLERKFAARMQSRIGPYRVGPHGLLQPIADALKLMIK